MTIKTIVAGIAGLLAAAALATDSASAQRYDRDYDGGYDEGDKGNDWFFDYLTEGSGNDRDREIYGRVLAVKSVRVGNQQQRHLVALINTYTPHFNLVVDLGPEWQARRLDLRPYGDRLWVRGESVIIGGRQVLMADSARTEKRRITVDHFDNDPYQRPVIHDHRDNR
jgi:hypothetical protein